MKEEKMVPSYDGTLLRFRKDTVENPKALIVIAHGLCEHLNRYDYITQKLNENGYSVYRYDQRGHGKSEGKRIFFSDFNEMSDDANVIVDMARAESNEKKVFLLGHSMGGETVVLFGIKYPGKVDGIITSGALTYYNTKFMGNIFPIQESPETYISNELSGGVCSDPKVIEAYTKDPLVEKQISIGLINQVYKGIEFIRKNSKRFKYPILIMHGADDGIVSAKDSTDLFLDIQSTDKNLIIYSKLYHEILNEPSKDEIIADILFWTSKRI